MRAKKLAAILLLAGCAAIILSLPARPALAGNAEALGQTLGAVSLLPPATAVALSFLTGHVVFSLLAGYAAGVALLARMGGGGAAAAFSAGCAGLLETVTERENACVLLLCAVIGGLVAVLRRSGGLTALAARFAGRLAAPRKANLAALLMSLFFFFDDYANALLTAPAISSVTDRAGVSRERLAYQVDTTAAPVAGIAVISSWVAVETAVIEQGLAAAGRTAGGFALLLQSIPYCFYCFFALAFLLWSILLGRELGPMLACERRARESVPASPASPAPGHDRREGRRIFTAAGCILLFLLSTLFSFYLDGQAAAVRTGVLSANAPLSLASLAAAIGQADTAFLVLRSALLASAAALLAGSLLRLFSPREGLEAWLSGAADMMLTLVVLILAWSLSGVVRRLGTAYFVVEAVSAAVPPILLPPLLFACCCFVSFAAGSYGCLFMVMPMAIPLAQAMAALHSLPPESRFLPLCVGAVLSGSIFGDHASPLTDCTILSALSSGCDTMSHVKTQLPYTLIPAAAALLFLALAAAQPAPLRLLYSLGLPLLALPLLLAGRRP